MPSFQYNNLQSRSYVDKLLGIYSQSELPYVELPTLPTDTGSASNNNDRDSDSNTNLILDYNIAVNSAISSAVLLRNKDVAPALRQIHSR